MHWFNIYFVCFGDGQGGDAFIFSALEDCRMWPFNRIFLSEQTIDPLCLFIRKNIGIKCEPVFASKSAD